MNGKYNINAWNDLPKDVTEAEKLNILRTDSDIINFYER